MPEIPKNIADREPKFTDEEKKKAASAERQEQFRREIKSLTEHISREAARQKPPRHIRFLESPIGSKRFQNKRFFDKETRRVVSEEVEYDPGMFWDGPPGAFYALLWHEFGHGETRHAEAGESLIRKFGESMSGEPLLARLANVEEDVFIDSNNQEDRSGLRGPYRACYEYFFPFEAKANRPEIKELLEKAGFLEEQIAAAIELESIARRPEKLLSAIKHEAFWHHAHERAGIPEEDRPPNPHIDDEKLKEVWERIVLFVREAGNAKLGTVKRAEMFEEKIAPEAAALLEERKQAVAEAMRMRFGEEKLEPGDVESLIDQIRRDARKEELARIDGDIAAAEELMREADEEAAKLERETEAEGQEDKAGAEETEEGGEEEKESADASEIERLRQRSAELAAEAGSLRAQREELLKPKQEEGRGEQETSEEEAERLAKELLRALEEYRESREGKSPTHALRVAVDIDKTDEHHPENPDFGTIFIVEGKEEKGEGTETKIPTPPKPHTGKPERPAQTSLDRLAEYGISEDAHRDYLEIKKLVDERVLHELVNGLVALFTEDRERLIISNLPYGRLPVTRKSEAVRRRYQGEALPPVYEIRKIVERFMGVDLVAVVDNSESMLYGDKVTAAKAAQLALAHSAYRVNSEISRRMRALGVTDAQIERTPPLRYLGILFSDSAKAMNKRGWDSSLSGHGTRFEDQEMDEEKFVIQTFETYNHMDMRGTYDHYAAALALYEAFKDMDSMSKTEERVKIICFITDGAGYVYQMKPLMSYLHGKSDEFPDWLMQELRHIDSESADKIKERIIKYKDQVFAIGIGIGSRREERELFANVYNEGVIPNEQDARAYEDNNVALISNEEAPVLPKKLLGVLRAKFGSPAFRRIRQKYSR